MVRQMRCILVLVALAAAPAHANPDDPVLDAALVQGWATDSGTHMAGMSLMLAPGWKTYWRSPGEAGIPPLFDWSGSENLGAVQFHWPTPDVFHISGMVSIGYHDGLMLPIEVTPLDPTLPVLLRARVEIGVCEEICVPAMLSVNTVLTGPGMMNPAIKAALRDQPVSAAEAGLTGITCTVDPTEDGLRVTASMDLPELGRDETVVIETGLPDVWVSQAVTMRTAGHLTAAADLVAPSGAPFALDRAGVVVTVIGEGQAVEIRGCPAD